MTFAGLTTRFASGLSLVLAITLMSGCASRQPRSADETFAAANKDFEGGAYDAAIEAYKELLDRHPFSEHATEAETRIARAYYLLGRHAEAIAAFSDFERMHPTSPDVPLATYYLGMSYLQQMRPLDRDQSASQNAHAYFRAVIDRYPRTPWADRARLRLRECEEVLAEHELYVIRFYLRHNTLAAAEARFQGLLEAYPHTEAAAKALYRFGDEYQLRERYRPAALSFRALVETHPDNTLSALAETTLAHLDNDGARQAASAADPLRELIRELEIGTGALAIPNEPREDSQWIDPPASADSTPAAPPPSVYDVY